MGDESQQEQDNLTEVETLTSEYVASLEPISNTIEGNYDSWADTGILINVGATAPKIFFTGTKLAYNQGNSTTMFDLITEDSVVLSNTQPYAATASYGKCKESVMNKYILDLEGRQVLKDGVQAQVFVLPEEYSMMYSMFISKDGQYIAIVLFNDPNYYITIFRGT